MRSFVPACTRTTYRSRIVIVREGENSIAVARGELMQPGIRRRRLTSKHVQVEPIRERNGGDGDREARVRGEESRILIISIAHALGQREPQPRRRGLLRDEHVRER